MNRMPIHLLTASLFVVAVAAPRSAEAATLIRTPYLQMAGPDRITIIFHTDVDIGTPEVEYGTTVSLGSSATGAAGVAHTTYEPPAGLVAIPNFKYVVELSGLAPNTKYFYSVGSTTAQITTAGEDHAFTTAPPHGTSSQAIRIWAYGDSGYWPGAHGTEYQDNRQGYYDHITGSAPGAGTANDAADATDVMLYLGDNCYFAGSEKDCNRVFWTPADLSAFHSRQPFFSVMGNHEYYGGNNSITQTGDYFDSYYLPTANELGTNGVASGTESYYSFDYGNIHFVMLDTEANIDNFAARAAMLTWLENDLMATDSDWIIAAWHKPAYSAGLLHGSDTEEAEILARQHLVAKLDEFGADLVLSGHSHTYERSALMTGHYGLSYSLKKVHLVDGGDGDGQGPYRKATTSQEADTGTVYVVAGSSADVRSFHSAASPAAGSVAGKTHPAMVRSLVQLGTLSVEVDGLTLTGRMVDDTGVVSDTFRIEKGPRCPAALTVAGCAEAGKSRLKLKKNPRTSVRDSAVLRISKTAFDEDDFDPFSGANNAFCLYEDGSLVMEAVAPDASFESYDTADSSLNPDVSWVEKPGGLFLFKDKTLSWDGTQSVRFLGGDRGRFLQRMRGTAAGVPSPPLSEGDIAVVAAVRNLDNDACIYSVMDTPKRNQSGTFVAYGTLDHGPIVEPPSPTGAFVDGPIVY